MKKKYNPFKMWGSYIGGYLAPTLVFLIIHRDKVGGIHTDLGQQIISAFTWWTTFAHMDGIELLLMLGIVSGGFLLGWGIHSLIRRFK